MYPLYRNIIKKIMSICAKPTRSNKVVFTHEYYSEYTVKCRRKNEIALITNLRERPKESFTKNIYIAYYIW